MELDDNRPPRVSNRKRLFNVIVPILIIILLVVYLILSLLPGKPNVDVDTSKKLLHIALALAPVKQDEQWNTTRY